MATRIDRETEFVASTDNFSRPVNGLNAPDGTLHLPRASLRLDPVKPGLTFHGLRHSHKTWLIADGAPGEVRGNREVLEAYLGH